MRERRGSGEVGEFFRILADEEEGLAGAGIGGADSEDALEAFFGFLELLVEEEGEAEILAADSPKMKIRYGIMVRASACGKKGKVKRWFVKRRPLPSIVRDAKKPAG
ncbi:MAG: hypothetical protein GVY10_02150 [Verrucomicrobia bacterium]|nr:hypothetical protein [Verrucomicrobiota bacterium]